MSEHYRVERHLSQDIFSIIQGFLQENMLKEIY